MNNYVEILGRAVAVYLTIVISIRLFGKKELAQLSVVDLVFILLISNAVQNAMVGSDTSLSGGLVAATGLFITNYILKKLINTSSFFNKILQGEPLILIYQGKVKHNMLKKSGLSLAELEVAIREHGIEYIEHVELAILEIDGNISVLAPEKHTIMPHYSKKRKFHKVINKN
jgi:uncharacterized membrane protein YcaP (DUF421 family)